MKKYLLYSVLLLLPMFINASTINSSLVSDGEGVTYVNDHYLNNQKVEYQIYGDIGVMDGDIMLGPVEVLENRKEEYESGIKARGAAVRTNSRWPKGVIPYQFASHVSSTKRRDTINAMNEWMKYTPIRFVQRTNQRSYLFIKSDRDGVCSSYVGYVQAYYMGKQDLNLGNGCNYQEALHELGHAMGLYHEHNRADRDSYVSIKWSNVIPEYRYALNKYTNGQDIGTYDYNSIMHYGAYDVSIDRSQASIIPYYVGLDVIGKRQGLSSGDVKSIKKLYSDNNLIANMTSPKNRSRLPGRVVTFRWNATAGNQVYMIVRASGTLFSGYVNKNYLTLKNLPVDGRKITVTLITYTTTGAVQKHYSYTAFLAKPTKPSGVSITELESNSATIRWMDNSNNEKGFKIYRGTTLIKTLPANTRSYTITNLNPETAYVYTIKSYNDAGVSSAITVRFTTKKKNLSWFVPVDYNMVY